MDYYLSSYFKHPFMCKKNDALSIYTSIHCPRLSYTISLIFDQLLGINCELLAVSDTELRQLAQAKKTNSENSFLLFCDESLSISSHLPVIFYTQNHLFEQEGWQPRLSVAHKQTADELHYLFYHGHEAALLPFDVFSAVFYLVSRYEEYDTAHGRDEHGRFQAQHSLAYQKGFLHLPIIEIWVKLLAQNLQNRFPILRFNPPKYRFQPTFDIDMAWAYKHKNAVQTLGRVAIELLTLNLEGLKNRLNVLFNNQQDPFFTFDALEEIHEKSSESPIFFFLVGKYGTYDKNTTPKNKYFQALIQQISQKYSVGIHPSYGSNQAQAILAAEIKTLHELTKTAITHSRQHFLKLTLPTTYRRLLAEGIEQDWSMGYAEQLGFRAGISQPFFWFDLQSNQATNLRIVPFAIMDVTLRVYLRLSPEQALTACRSLIETLRKTDGQLVTLWHNSSLSDIDEWKGWNEVYTQVVNEAI